MPQIQKADPKERRKAILSVIIGVIAGTSLFFVLEFRQSVVTEKRCISC